MNKSLQLSLFGLLALVQLAIPGFMIIQQEDVCCSGTLYKFACEPIDPIDHFRGRYVMVSPKTAQFKVANATQFSPGEKVFATVRVDPQGFAVIDRLVKNVPESGDYFPVRVRWILSDGVRLELPFERYYMKESQAPQAERAYWQAAGVRNRQPCWIAVKIKNGKTVLDNLYINAMPIREYLEKHPDKKP